MVSFYRFFAQHAGAVYDTSAYHQFSYPMNGFYNADSSVNPGGIDRINALAVSKTDANEIFAWSIDPAGTNSFVYRSANAGVSWTQLGQFPGRNGQIPQGIGTDTGPTGQLYVAVHTDNTLTSRRDGVWRSTDNGLTWTRILPCEGSAINWIVPTSGAGANNSTVTCVMSGPGACSAAYSFAVGVSTDLEFAWTAGNGSWWTAQLETVGAVPIPGATYALGSGTSGTLHITSLGASWPTAGQIRFSTSTADTLTGPLSAYHGLPASFTRPRGCFSLAMGASKLWFLWQVSGQFLNFPYPPPPLLGNPWPQALYRIEQANPDGSSRGTIGELTSYAPSEYSGEHDNIPIAIRPYGDQFVLIPSFRRVRLAPPSLASGGIWKVDVSGGVTQVNTTPVGGLILDAVPLGPTTYLATAAHIVSGAWVVDIYRTTNGGTTWALLRSLTGTDATETSLQPLSTETAAAYQIAAFGSAPLEALVNGGQGNGPGTSTPQPIVTWHTLDQGDTWEGLYFTDQPSYTSGDMYPGWQLRSSGGILPGLATVIAPPAVAIPSRLATIVG